MTKPVTEGFEVGLLAGMASPALLDIAGRAGFRSIVLDGEHGYPMESDLASVRRACHGSGSRCLLRVSLNQIHQVSTACDTGIDGIVVSNAASFAELEQVARFMLPPPLGKRSVNPFTEATPKSGDVGSFIEACEKLDLWAMIETTEMVAALAKASSGAMPPLCKTLLTTIVIGPYDLSAAFGEVCSPRTRR